MDGLARAGGAGVDFQALGKPWHFSPLRLRDYSRIEQHLLAMRPNPLDAIKDDLPMLSPENQRFLLGRAMDEKLNRTYNKIPFDSVMRWVESFDGLVFVLFMSLSRKHADVTQETCADIVEELGEERIVKILRMASGLDKAGNSTGPNREEGDSGVVAKLNPSDPSLSPGHASSAA